MRYEINVSLNGWHFFATHERSLKTERDFLAAKEVFQKKFPASEGYSLSFTRIETKGYSI